MGEEAADAAGREDRETGAERERADLHAVELVVFHQQFGGGGVFEDRDVRAARARAMRARIISAPVASLAWMMRRR